MKYERGRL